MRRRALRGALVPLAALRLQPVGQVARRLFVEPGDNAFRGCRRRSTLRAETKPPSTRMAICPPVPTAWNSVLKRAAPSLVNVNSTCQLPLGRFGRAVASA